MKKLAILFLKISISVAIIWFLIWRAQQDNAFTNLRDQPKRWGMFVIAWFFCASAVLTTIVRWHFLIRALEIPSRLTNSLRIGFLGYMFNLAPLGIIGGDAIKAVMLARGHKNTQARSIASVVVDRLIGLYMLFVVATAAILVTGFWRTGDLVVTRICSITYWITALGALGIGLLMIPAVSDGKLVRAMEQLPRVGHPIKSLIDAMRMYRRRPGVLFAAAVMSAGVHSLFAIGIYFIACGLPGDVHSLGTHFVMSPLSASMGAIPLSIGPFEFMLDSLYVLPIGGVMIAAGQGFVVALGYRIITVLIAAIGACYYIGARAEVAQSLREAGDDDSSESNGGEGDEGDDIEPVLPGSTIAMSTRLDSSSAA